MLPYITYIQIYVSVFSSILLTFCPGLFTYKSFALVMAFIGALVIIVELCKQRRHIYQIGLVSAIGLFIVFLYLITEIKYPKVDERYYSYLLVLVGQVLPVIICSSIIAHKEDVQYQIKCLSLPIAIIFGLIAFYSGFFPTSETSGGYVANENNLNYQSTSYLAAYSAGLSLYYLYCSNNIHWDFFLSESFLSKIMKGMLFVNFLTILIAGGRGALVLFVIEICFYLYILYKSKRISMKNALRVCAYFVISVVVILIGIYFAANSHIKTSGFDRILKTIYEGHQSGREVFREIAYIKFIDSPIIGHGIGSVFNEVGMYTHNFLLDSLVEAGIIGAFIYSLFIFISVRKGWSLFKSDNTNFLWLIIFLHGFGMSLFSGYYLAQLPLFWAGTFMLCKDLKNNHV